MSRKFNFHEHSTRITGTSQEYVFKLIIISRWILLRIRNISHKICTENLNIHFMFNDSFPENRAVYEIMWKNMVQPDRPQMKMQYGTCALHAGYLRLQTHTQNIYHLSLFPLEQRLRERAPMLRYTDIHCLIISVFVSDSRHSYCGVVFFVFFANERYQLKGKNA